MSPMERKPEIHLVLDRLRSAHNVGNIFRLADAVGAAEVICCGYTAAPPHPKLAKTAMGAEKTVPFRSFPTAAEAVAELRKQGCRAVAVETVPEAVDVWNYDFPQRVALVFGNEALGISPEALGLCDGFVSLPMFGTKESINVGNCAAVVLYMIVAKGTETC